MAKYFIDPFGISGDKTTIPDAAPIDGSVSYSSGFGVDYQLDPGSDPSALNVPRDKFNELMYQVTLAIQQYQQFGFPDFITSADNGGTPFLYSTNATVRYSGVNYYSLVDNNGDTPPSVKWGVVSFAVTAGVPTGTGVDFWGSTLPSGYVWANGTTIGNASSGATGRANADTSALFTLLWNACSNTVLPIQDSAGAASTRGASAATDYAANKRLPVPDKRDLVSAGKGDMGGTTDRGLITSAGSGINGATLGASGGSETVALTSNQNALHAHDSSPITVSTSGAHTHTVGYWNTGPGIVGNDLQGQTQADSTYTTSTAGAHTHTLSGNTGNSGLGAAHQNIQPTIICNYIIKL